MQKQWKPRHWDAPDATYLGLVGSPLAGSRAHSGAPWLAGIPGLRFSKCLGQDSHQLTHFSSPAPFCRTTDGEGRGGRWPKGHVGRTGSGLQRNSRRKQAEGWELKGTVSGRWMLENELPTKTSGLWAEDGNQVPRLAAEGQANGYLRECSILLARHAFSIISQEASEKQN